MIHLTFETEIVTSSTETQCWIAIEKRQMGGDDGATTTTNSTMISKAASSGISSCLLFCWLAAWPADWPGGWVPGWLHGRLSRVHAGPAGLALPAGMVSWQLAKQLLTLMSMAWVATSLRSCSRLAPRQASSATGRPACNGLQPGNVSGCLCCGQL